MAIPAQILKLCAVSVLGGLILLAMHGVPMAGPAPDAGPVAACGADALEQPAPALTWISVDDARGLLGDDSVAFVDCRSMDAFEQARVSGSLHLPDGGDPTEPGFIDTLRSASTVITYCSGACGRSAEMATRFAAAGLPDVRVLEGGLPAWLEHGLPAEFGACQHCDSHN